MATDAIDRILGINGEGKIAELRGQKPKPAKKLQDCDLALCEPAAASEVAGDGGADLRGPRVLPGARHARSHLGARPGRAVARRRNDGQSGQSVGWVEGLGRFVAEARDLKLGRGRFPDDAEVILLYDMSHDHFDYAVNLACDWCSVWGYASFGE
jgi:hypothetical protein